MRVKVLQVLVGVGAPLILAGAADAGFVGVTTSFKSVPGIPGFPQSAIVANIFAHFDRPGQDLFLGVVGTPNSPMDVHVVGGTFYQNPFGGDKAPSAALIQIFPSLAFDTFVTIGVKKVGAPGGQSPDALQLSPGWPGFSPTFLGGTNLGWSVSPNDPQADPFNPGYVNGNGRVLIGQFTTTNSDLIVGMFRVLVRSNNVDMGFNVSFCTHITCPLPPAPGALGLLGVAGLLGSRRRRRL